MLRTGKARQFRQRRQESGADIAIREHLPQQRRVAEDGLARLNAQVHAAARLFDEQHFAKLSYATAQERAIAGRREGLAAFVERIRRLRIDVDLAIALDIDQAADIEDVEPIVPTERRRARRFAASDRIVQKLEMHASSESGAKLSNRKRSISRCDMPPRCALRAM